jgi:predicted XRE-type DNA-binding protein
VFSPCDMFAQDDDIHEIQIACIIASTSYRMIRMSELLAAIRKAIEECGQSRYRISQETGITQSQLSRIMHGEAGMSLETLEIIAAYLGLEITIRPKQQQKKGK